MASGIAVLILAAAAAAGGEQEAQPAGGAPVRQAVPGPTTAGTAAPPPLKIDVGKAIAEVVARMLATPHFDEHVEVRDRYQEALDSYLRAADLACGATAAGPPPQDEMNRFRETKIPPHADLLAGAKWLVEKLKQQGTSRNGRYYLYAVRAKSAAGRVVYVVRDGAISEQGRSSVPGVTWELLGRYAEQGKASRAVAELLRTGSADGAKESRVLWAATRCPH